MKSGIYMIKCIQNEKIYIGHSKNIGKRIVAHMNSLIGGYHDNDHIQKCFKKYGKDSFEFKIIELCDEKCLIEREYFWIDYYGSCNPEKGFNIVYNKSIEKNIKEKRNPHGLLNHYKTEEGKKRKNKMSITVKSLWKNPEYAEKIRKKRVELWKNTDYRKKQSNDAKQRWNDETYRKKYIDKWNDPIWKSETLKKQKEGRDKNLNYINEVIEREKNKWSNPEYKKKMCVIAKNKWKDPQYREKAIRKSKEARENLKDGGYTEESRRKISEASKKRWADPEYRKMVSEKIKESKSRNRCRITMS